VSHSAVYRLHADEILKLALQTADLNERGRLIGLASHWHMMAADIDKGLFPTADDFALDGLAIPEEPPPEPADEAS
jgi:hypothetical protein